jgi:hypothetical protein
MGALDGMQRTARNAEADREKRTRPNFNADKTRYISREFLGWVCYVGRVTNGEFAGQRVGVSVDEEVAQRWLDGDDEVKWDIPADPYGNLIDHSGSSR